MLIPTEPAVTIVERMVSEGAGVGMRLAGYRVLETRRIEAGIPLLGVDMDESHMLLETGLDDAVSFNKGCYIGHEYVARLAHRGHLNRKLVGLKLIGDALPSPGDDIMGDGRYVGQVTSATYSPRLGIPIAMGYVHRDFFEPGTEVAIRIGDSVAPARVANLPFLSRNEDIHTDR
jgi:aminomethyltransferase